MERPGRPKNRRKNITYFRTYFFNKKICQKRVPKGVQKGDGISGVAALGAPWTSFDAPVCFWTQKVYPKCSQNNLQGAKVTTKCFKSDPQGRKMHSYRSAKVVQVHQKMSAARYQARRTARSAFNNANKKTYIISEKGNHKFANEKTYIISEKEKKEIHPADNGLSS